MRAQVVVSFIGSALLLLSLFFPWWFVNLGSSEAGSASLTLYSLNFHTAQFSCTSIMFFYPYEYCPLFGGGSGAARLSFYLFWSLAFISLSFSLNTVLAISLVRRYLSEQRRWFSLAGLVFVSLSIVSFIAALSTAGLKFVGSNPFFGGSTNASDLGGVSASWSVSTGFLMVVVSLALQLCNVYLLKNHGTGDAIRTTETSPAYDTNRSFSRWSPRRMKGFKTTPRSSSRAT